MKKVIIISVLSLLIQSCANFNFGNFNKQKFTNLKTKSVKFDETKIADQPSSIDKIKRAKINNIEQQTNNTIIDSIYSNNEIASKQKVIHKKPKQKQSILKLVKRKNYFKNVSSHTSLLKIVLPTKNKMLLPSNGDKKNNQVSKLPDDTKTNPFKAILLTFVTVLLLILSISFLFIIMDYLAFFGLADLGMAIFIVGLLFLIYFATLIIYKLFRKKDKEKSKKDVKIILLSIALGLLLIGFIGFIFG